MMSLKQHAADILIDILFNKICGGMTFLFRHICLTQHDGHFPFSKTYNNQTYHKWL
mgnify:CR=1 FL=1